MAGVPAGDTADVIVALDAALNPTAPPDMIPGTVWPMLHADTGVVGVYEYLMVPGADLPVIVDGAVVAYPVPVGMEGAPAPTPTSVPTATAAPTVEPTHEATPEETPEGTPEGTPEATPDATEPRGGEPTPDVTLPAPEPTPDATAST
jgi:hypothetical protein